MVTLAIDAATYVGSVAVVRGAALVAERSVAMRGEREERLMPAVDEALRAAGLAPRDVGRVVCGGGPGSFTSLRIAAAIAKGVASAIGGVLYAVPSPVLLVAGVEPALAVGRYLALLDAMRGEVFAATVDVAENGAVVQQTPSRLLARDAVSGLAGELGATTIGAGATVEAAPHARGVVRLLGWLNAAAPVELDGWEPEYGRAAEAQVRWEAAHGRPLPRG